MIITLLGGQTVEFPDRYPIQRSGRGIPDSGHRYRGLPILYRVKRHRHWELEQETVVAYVDTNTQYRAEGLMWERADRPGDTFSPHASVEWEIYVKDVADDVADNLGCTRGDWKLVGATGSSLMMLRLSARNTRSGPKPDQSQ